MKVSMTQKQYKLATAIVGGIETLAVGLITYFVQDTALSAKIDAAIVIAGTAALEICQLFVKPEA